MNFKAFLHYQFFIWIVLMVIIGHCIPSPMLSTTSLPNSDRVLVVNGLSETVSVINPVTDVIYNDLYITDRVPNQILTQNENLYILNSYSNSIQVFDKDTMTYLGKRSLPAGMNPWEMAFKDATSPIAYVTGFLQNNLVVINTATNTILQTIDLTDATRAALPSPEYPRPEGISIYADKVYVAASYFNYSTLDHDPGEVIILDKNTHQILKRLPVCLNPTSLLIFPLQQEIHVVCTGKNNISADDGKIQIVDLLTENVIQTITMGGSPGKPVIDATNNIVFLAGLKNILSYNYLSKVAVHDSTDPFYTSGDSANGFISGLTIDPLRNKLYACDFSLDRVLVIDKTTGLLLSILYAGDGAQFPLFILNP